MDSAHEHSALFLQSAKQLVNCCVWCGWSEGPPARSTRSFLVSWPHWPTASVCFNANKRIVAAHKQCHPVSFYRTPSTLQERKNTTRMLTQDNRWQRSGLLAWIASWPGALPGVVSLCELARFSSLTRTCSWYDKHSCVINGEFLVSYLVLALQHRFLHACSVTLCILQTDKNTLAARLQN